MIEVFFLRNIFKVKFFKKRYLKYINIKRSKIFCGYALEIFIRFELIFIAEIYAIKPKMYLVKKFVNNTLFKIKHNFLKMFGTYSEYIHDYF